MEAYWNHLVRPLLGSVEAKTIVEVGAGNASNTTELLNYAKAVGGVVVAIDPNPAIDTDELSRDWGSLLEYRNSPSSDVLPFLDQYDAIFIDGDRNSSSLVRELEAVIISTESQNFSFPLVFLQGVTGPGADRDWCSVSERGEPQDVVATVENFRSSHGDRYSFVYVPGFYGFGVLFDSNLPERLPEFASVVNAISPSEPLRVQLEALEQARIDCGFELIASREERDREYRARRAIDQKIQETVEELGLGRFGGPITNLTQLLNTVVEKEADAASAISKVSELERSSEQAQRELNDVREELIQVEQSKEVILTQLEQSKLQVSVGRMNARRLTVIGRSSSLQRDIQVKAGWIREVISHYESVMPSLGWRLGGVLFGRQGDSFSLSASVRSLPWAPHHAAEIIVDFQTWEKDRQEERGTSDVLSLNWLEQCSDTGLTEEQIQSWSSALEDEDRRIQRFERANDTLTIWLNGLIGHLEVVYRSRRFCFGKWFIDQGIKRLLGKPSFISTLPFKTQAVKHQLEGLTKRAALSR